MLPSTHKSSRSVPFLSPVGTHSYQQSHCCSPHTNQAVPYLSSAQSVPTVTNSHTAALHTQSKLFRTFPQPSRYPQLPTVTLLPSTHKSSRSVTFLNPVGTHSYQQSHCCPPHTNQAVPCLSSAQSVPTVTDSHTAALHTQNSVQMLHYSEEHRSSPILLSLFSSLPSTVTCIRHPITGRTSGK